MVVAYSSLGDDLGGAINGGFGFPMGAELGSRIAFGSGNGTEISLSFVHHSAEQGEDRITTPSLWTYVAASRPRERLARVRAR